jgi:hypothetical protein
MLLSKARERDVVGNTMPENMAAAKKRLEPLTEATIRERNPGTGQKVGRQARTTLCPPMRPSVYVL